MKEESVLLRKTYAFAVEIAKVSRRLTNEAGEHILARQLLKAGTSVGANAEEADGSGSAKDFAAKLRISYKEACGTHYWLRLIRDTGTLPVPQAESLINDCVEIKRIISKSLTTVSRRLRR